MCDYIVCLWRDGTLDSWLNGWLNGALARIAEGGSAVLVLDDIYKSTLDSKQGQD